ncbi:MAG: glucosaminidase domain-containing protein [Bacteroidaceae bacterium]|nr:glucosaminidase domain-containing protein [Bacteroidaceae bacterium]MBR6170925.1 glucosaminidase domain-containing protein [Bacteroidaceae bacterium]
MKSRLFSIFSLLLFLHLTIYAQRTNQAYWSYIDQYKGLAIEQMKKHRIPASITLAQGLLESGAGRSTLATKANNHFGIKVSGYWTGPYVLKNDDAPNEKFRKYRNARESYEDHSKFLQGRRYQGLFQLKITDYRGWARGLKAAGYATSPTYAESLIRIIEMYNLYQFDTGKYNQEKKVVTSVSKAQDSFFQKHTVYAHNKNYFIIVEIGDNMATISKETGVSLKKLYQYNDLPLDYAPTQGDLIYLKKKQKCASKQFKKNPIHIVEQNQSLFDISQLYGIRLKYLYKMNDFTPSHEIKPGDIIRIR